MIHYISYGFWLVLIGSVLGLILGPIMILPLFYPSMTRVYKMPIWEPVWSINFVFLAVAMVIFSLAVSYYAISTISNEKPSESIKPKAPKVSNSGFIEKPNIWKKACRFR